MLSNIISPEVEASFEFGELAFETIQDAANYCLLLETEGEYKKGAVITVTVGDMTSGEMIFDNMDDAIRALIYCAGETIE